MEIIYQEVRSRFSNISCKELFVLEESDSSSGALNQFFYTDSFAGKISFFLIYLFNDGLGFVVVFQ